MSTAELILSVVRGEQDWTVLVRDGWPIREAADGFHFGATLRNPVTASAEDLAAGLLKVSRLETASQRRWARFILAAADVVDLDVEGAGSLGERLLDELWEVSAGNDISPEVLLDAQQLVAKGIGGSAV